MSEKIIHYDGFNYCVKKFTLIEMLVVIMIISILASLMVPALRMAYDKAYEVSCANNMKQAGISFYIYSQDNNGLVEIDWNNQTWVKSLTGFQYDQQNALKEIYTKRFHCPATFSDWDGTSYNYRDSFYLATVYGGNLNTAGFASVSIYEPVIKNPSFYYLTVRLSEIPKAERKINGKLPLISESVRVSPNFPYCRLFPSGGTVGANLASHNGMANYLLSDGRVKSGDMFVFKNELFCTRGSIDGANIIDF